MSQQQKKILTHTLISVSYALFWIAASIVASTTEDPTSKDLLYTYLWKIAYISLVNLLLYTIVLPVFRRRKTKWLLIISMIIPAMAIIFVGFYGWNMLGSYLHVTHQWNANEWKLRYIVPNIIHLVFGLIYHATIYFILATARLHARNQELIIEKKVSELNYLKSQTNPHFLFNTLNGIYVLAREKSDVTADTVLRLSDILRYMLYVTQSEQVPLRQEVQIMEDYIELEKLRYDGSLNVSFDVSIDDPQQMIPPLLFIHLVENAFKHGASEALTHSFISIDLTVQKEKLRFSIRNSVVQNDSPNTIKENIGLTNLRRQLSLLFTDYQLDLQRTADSFTANLTINLTSYAKN